MKWLYDTRLILNVLYKTEKSTSAGEASILEFLGEWSPHFIAINFQVHSE